MAKLSLSVTKQRVSALPLFIIRYEDRDNLYGKYPCTVHGRAETSVGCSLNCQADHGKTIQQYI